MRAQLVRDGALGDVRLVQVEYIQSGLATRLEDGPQNNRLRWMLDPRAQRPGAGDERDRLPRAASRVLRRGPGRSRASCADVGALMPGRKVVDYVSALIEFEGGARGTFTVTQAAAGGENDIRLRVYGEKGMLDWWHREPSYLRLALQGEPVRVDRPRRSVPAAGHHRARDARRAAIPKACARRSPTSTPRSRRSAWRARSASRAPALPYPRIEDGAHTMAFIEACIASQARGGGWADVARMPG